MLGSIIGDIVGSTYEFSNIKQKDFPLFTPEKEYTDDSILTIATADWLLHGGDVAHYYLRYAKDNPTPMGSYGSGFVAWVHRGLRGLPLTPYNSCGNGSAMRVGPVGWAFESEAETLAAAKESAECTHNHPEGIKGAQAVALAIYLARHDADKDTIRQRIEHDFGYDLHFTCDAIRSTYTWGGTCQDSVPQAIVAFLDATNFEDAVRNAISIGGDSDTIGCITASIAEACYGIPTELRSRAVTYLPTPLLTVVEDFEEKYGSK